MSNSQIDPRRPDRVKRYKSSYSLQFSEDQLQEYMNVLGMIFSMCGLMMKVNKILVVGSNLKIYIYDHLIKVKWCAWMSVCCSFVGFANAKGGEDTKQVLSCFM